MTVLSLKSERPSLSPAQLELLRPRAQKKLQLWDIPVGCVFPPVLRGWGTGAGARVSKHSRRAHKYEEENTGRFAFHCWQLAQPLFSPACLIYYVPSLLPTMICFSVLSSFLFFSFYHGPYVYLLLSQGSWLMGRITVQSHTEYDVNPKTPFFVCESPFKLIGTRQQRSLVRFKCSTLQTILIVTLTI